MRYLEVFEGNRRHQRPKSEGIRRNQEASEAGIRRY